MSYTRSFISPQKNCSLGVREQGNVVSSFIDASHIYGQTKEDSQRLRSLKDGFLKTNQLWKKKDILPSLFNTGNCKSPTNSTPCFDSGSTMTNLLPTSAALHTIFVRQHNEIAKNLKKINFFWNDERLFQEARRILIAQIQHITYNEWLPILLGRNNLRKYDLSLRAHGFDSDYNMKINPTTLNEFASAAGFFFFAMFPEKIGLINKNGNTQNLINLSDFFYNPSQLYIQDRVDSIIRFLTQTPGQTFGAYINKEFTNKFLRESSEFFGLDLAALIIQMGRDHGINSYTEWRKLCKLTGPKNFDELENIVHKNFDLEKLKSIYKTVDDIDLFVLGLAEKPLDGALLGPTFSCIVGRQFQLIKHGDRFWYENFFQPSAFTEIQLNEIRQTTLAQIICKNTDNINKINPNIFQLPDNYLNCLIACNATQTNEFNYNLWIDQEQKRQSPITNEILEKALKLGAEQYRRLQEAERNQIVRDQNLSKNKNKNTAFVSHANLLAPKQESLNLAQVAGIYRETTNVLLNKVGLNENNPLFFELDTKTLQKLLPEIDVSKVIGNISDFVESKKNNQECLPRPLPCDHTNKYRTFSGWCNNLNFPYYGNAFEPLRRLLDPVYDDGFDTPRKKSKIGKKLPSARQISNIVHSDQPKFHVKFSHMLMQMGQLIDHDITHSPIARGPGNSILNCSRCDSFETLSIHCFPIPIEKNDPHFPHVHNDGTPRCIPFTRSLLGQISLGYRNQLNQLTSFLDASNVYGSTECEVNALRLFNRGQLNFTNLGYSKEALPQGQQERDCRSRPKHPCFMAGDERNNIQPGLTVLHTILLRQHNRIATILNKINNFWSDEKIFQEARRIMIAQQQHVIYNEFLPIILGCDIMSRYDLAPRRYGYYKGYDSTCDASVSQELATAAFRFGHTLIRNQFPRMNTTFQENGLPINLLENFNNVSLIYDKENGHIDAILIGLLGAPGMDYDRHIVDAVRNHLFQKPNLPLTGLDLPAINIQRGRDHGIPPYNSYRKMCGLPKVYLFEDLLSTMDKSAVESLKKVYAHVDDIDLFAGLMSERPIKGALVGPMLACIIAEQFQRLKRCDRFYYENNNSVIRFTPSQLAEIRKTTMSKIICENSEWIKKIQPNVFFMPDDLTNALVNCSELSSIDLLEWLDRQFCIIDQRIINLSQTKRITPCITCTCTAEGPECHSIVIENCKKLFDEYSLSEIKNDTVCSIQCAKAIREKSKIILK